MTEPSLLHSKALQHLRADVPDDQVSKVGIVPYVVEGGVRHYLVAAPNPTKNTGDVIPFALVRGTRKVIIAQDGYEHTEDMGRDAIWEKIDTSSPYQITSLEGFKDGALREGHEELGIPCSSKAFKALNDCNTLAYKDYGVRFFTGELKERPKTGLGGDIGAHASREVRLVSIEQAQAMAKTGEFNALYLDLLTGIDQAIETMGKFTAAARSGDAKCKPQRSSPTAG